MEVLQSTFLCLIFYLLTEVKRNCGLNSIQYEAAIQREPFTTEKFGDSTVRSTRSIHQGLNSGLRTLTTYHMDRRSSNQYVSRNLRIHKRETSKTDKRERNSEGKGKPEHLKPKESRLKKLKQILRKGNSSAKSKKKQAENNAASWTVTDCLKVTSLKGSGHRPDCTQGTNSSPPEIPIELGSPLRTGESAGKAEHSSGNVKCTKTAAVNCPGSRNEPPPAIPIELGSPAVTKPDKPSQECSSQNTEDSHRAVSVSKCKGSDGGFPPSVPIELGSAVVSKENEKEKEQSSINECEKLTAMINKKIEKCRAASNAQPPAIPIELGAAMVSKTSDNNVALNGNDTSRECEELASLINKKLEKCPHANSEPPPSIPIELGAPAASKNGKTNRITSTESKKVTGCQEGASNVDKDPADCKETNNEPPPAIPIELGSAVAGEEDTSNRNPNSGSNPCKQTAAAIEKDSTKCKQTQNEPPPAIPIELGSAVVSKQGGNKQSTKLYGSVTKECKEAAVSTDKDKQKCKQTKTEPPPAIPIELGSAVAPENKKTKPNMEDKASASVECEKQLMAKIDKKLDKCKQTNNEPPPAIPIELGSAVIDKGKKPNPPVKAKTASKDCEKELTAAANRRHHKGRRGSQNATQKIAMNPCLQAKKTKVPSMEFKINNVFTRNVTLSSGLDLRGWQIKDQQIEAKKKRRAVELPNEERDEKQNQERRTVGLEGGKNATGDDDANENLMYINEMETEEGNDEAKKTNVEASTDHRDNDTDIFRQKKKQEDDEINNTSSGQAQNTRPFQILQVHSEPRLSEQETSKNDTNERSRISKEALDDFKFLDESESGEKSLRSDNDGREWSATGEDSSSGVEVEAGSAEIVYNTAQESGSDGSGSGEGLAGSGEVSGTGTRKKRSIDEEEEEEIRSDLAAGGEYLVRLSRATSKQRKVKKKKHVKSSKHKRSRKKSSLIERGHIEKLLSSNLKDPEVKKYIKQMSSNVRTVVGQARNVLISTGQVVHGLRRVISGAGKLSEFAENAVKYANYFAREPDNATVDFLEEKAVLAVLEAQKAAREAKIEAAKAKSAASKAAMAAKRATVSSEVRSKIKKYASLAQKAKNKAVTAAKMAAKKANVVKSDALVVDKELRKIIDRLPKSESEKSAHVSKRIHKDSHSGKSAQIKPEDVKVRSSLKSTKADQKGQLKMDVKKKVSGSSMSKLAEQIGEDMAIKPDHEALTNQEPSGSGAQPGMDFSDKSEEQRADPNAKTGPAMNVGAKSDIGSSLYTDFSEKFAPNPRIDSNFPFSPNPSVGVNLKYYSNSDGKSNMKDASIDLGDQITNVSKGNGNDDNSTASVNVTQNDQLLEDINKYSVSLIGNEDKSNRSMTSGFENVSQIDYSAPGGDENYIIAQDHGLEIGKLNPVTSHSDVRSSYIQKYPAVPLAIGGTNDNANILQKDSKAPGQFMSPFAQLDHYPLTSTLEAKQFSSVVPQDSLSHDYEKSSIKGREPGNVVQTVNEPLYRIPAYVARNGNAPLRTANIFHQYRGLDNNFRRNNVRAPVASVQTPAPNNNNNHVSIKRTQIAYPFYDVNNAPYPAERRDFYPYVFGSMNALNAPKQGETMAMEEEKSKK